METFSGNFKLDQQTRQKKRIRHIAPANAVLPRTSLVIFMPDTRAPATVEPHMLPAETPSGQLILGWPRRATARPVDRWGLRFIGSPDVAMSAT